MPSRRRACTILNLTFRSKTTLRSLRSSSSDISLAVPGLGKGIAEVELVKLPHMSGAPNTQPATVVTK